MADFEHLICPVCRKPLKKMVQRLVCVSAHSFDLAGKGYVNLLLSRDKNSKTPGDSKAMVQARKSFLEKGYYAPLAEKLAEVFHKYLKADVGSVLLDAGCGDGYYTDYLQKFFLSHHLPCTLYGMDISREAVRIGAGRNKAIGFAVASLFKLPFQDHQADFILNAFAPSSDMEFLRVLKKDGHLITVIPGKQHLYELKSILYDTPYENDEKEPALPSFRLEEQIHVKSLIEINSPEDLSALVTMTPYYWRTPKEGLERLHQRSSLRTVIEFVISVYSAMGANTKC